AGALAAAIYLRRNGDETRHKTAAEKTARDMFDQNLTNALGSQLAAKASVVGFSAEDGVINFGAELDNPNFFAGIIGRDSTEVSVGTEALYHGPGELPVRVAMVLDNSASMQGTKLTNLKQASRHFVDVLEEADYDNDDGNLTIGVVPFSSYVNVGTGNRGRPWLRVEGEWSERVEVCHQPRKLVSRSNCREVTDTWTRFVDGVTKTGKRTYTKCDDVWENDGPKQCKMENQGDVWQGCVTTRHSSDYEAPFFKGEKFLGLPNLVCPNPITQLTTNLSKVRSDMNGMSANGNTMIPQGVQWGRILLEDRAPFTIGNETDEDLEYLIIMSDGDNTLERDKQSKGKNWGRTTIPVASVLHEATNNASDADDDTLAFCEAAKDDNIRVMTVAFDISPGSTAYKLMEKCASEPDLFHATQSIGKLKDIFEDMAETIAAERFRIRLAR
ncbi:MAG: hypothetical protein AAF638_11950, partial [Pseudomonadota bacterium]